jgi:hypothetical protein
MNRRQHFFSAWYQDQRQYRMGKEEWTYLAQLTIGCILAWGLGLIIGGIWLLFI